MASEVAAVPRVMTKAPPWHGWVTADLFLLSLASGTFAIASLAILLRPNEMDAFVRTAFYAVFPMMLADLACLIIDLGDPARFHHMLRTFKPRSPMSVGVWTISFFSFMSFLAFVGVLLQMPQGVVRAIAAIGLLPALVVGSYKGVLFSTTAQPGWRRMRWLGAAFALSSLAMGAAVMLTTAAMTSDAAASHLARFILMWLLVLDALTVRRVMGRAGAAGHLSDVGARTGGLRVSLNYLLFIVIGMGLPIMLCAFSKGAAAIDGAIVLLVLFGALVSRHYLVMIPHHAGRDDS